MKAIVSLIFFLLFSHVRASSHEALINSPIITNITYDSNTSRMVMEISEVEYGMFLYVWRCQTAMDLGNRNKSTLMQVFVIPDNVTYYSFVTNELQGYFWVGVSQLTPFPF